MDIKDSIHRNILFPIFNHSRRKLHELNFIFFELTSKCNLACHHCGSDCKKQPDAQDLPVSGILQTLRDIKSKYDPHKITVALSGGEPLCYPDLFSLGKKIHELEFPWGMVTNGFAWTKKTIKKAKEAGLASITVSLDGPEEEHNWLRGHPNSFKQAVNTINMLINNPFYQAMDVISCINKRNLKKIDVLYNLMKKLKVKSWRIFIISPIGRATEVKDLFLDEEEFKLLVDKISAFRKNDSMTINMSACSYLGSNYEKKVRQSAYFCKAGINIAGIMVNGDILACPNIDRRFKQGNIEKDNFTDIWENKYARFRDRSWMKTGKCKTCMEWKLCQGNGLHLWDIDNNRTRLCHFNNFGLQ